MPLEHPTVTYLPGRWSALAGDGVWLLVDLEPSSPILAACWEAVERGGGVDGLLGVILREGLRSVPSFGLVGRGPDGLRVLVSGKAEAEATSNDRPDPLLVSAAEAPTWIERRLDGDPDVRLRGEDAGGPNPPIALPLTRGVVLASALLVGGVASFSAESSAPAGPGNLTAEFEADGETPDAGPDVSAVLPVALDAAAAGAPGEPAGDAGDEPEQQPRTFDHLFGNTGNPLEGLDPLLPAEVGPASNDTMQPKPQDDLESSRPGVIEALPWRLPEAFGLEGASAQPAQPDPPPPAAPVAQPTVAPPPAAQPMPPPPVGARATHLVAPPPVAPQPYANSEPSAPPPPPAPSAPAYPPEPQRPSEPIAGPTVHAVQCANQHLNPPYATNCRVCSAPISQQDPFPAQRPTLGILNMSTGDMVPLDRDVVLGRAPFHADKSAQSRPHLVQLASPGNDISRSHVRVAIEGWHVQVTDLGSTNGTVVTIPGQAPVRLRAHDPFTIVPGTTITIADEVNVRYEVPT